MKPIEAFSTDRLLVTEACIDDLAAIHCFASDPEVVRFQSWGPNSLEDTQVFLEQVLREQEEKPRKSYFLVLRVKQWGGLIGGVSLQLADKAATAEMGFTLARSAWGQGFASEAAAGLVAFAFQRLGLRELVASCDRRNIGSKRVLEKCGFSYFLTIERHMMLRDGPRDSLFFRLEHATWLA